MLSLNEITAALTNELGKKLLSFTVERTKGGIFFTCVPTTKAGQKTWGFPERAIGKTCIMRGHYMTYHVTGDLLNELLKTDGKETSQ